MKKQYSQVQIGDKLLVNKQEVTVTNVYSYSNNFDNIIVKLTLSDGSIHFGWDYREVDVIQYL